MNDEELMSADSDAMRDAKARIAPVILDVVEKFASDLEATLERIQQDIESLQSEREEWLERGQTYLALLKHIDPLQSVTED